MILVSMPFGPLRVPSLGLSLLKAALGGIRSKIFYFGLSYATRIGVRLYEDIAFKEVPESAQLGEWIFRPGLFDSTPQDDEGYLREVILEGTPQARLGDSVIQQALEARAGVSDFLAWCAEQVLSCSPALVGFTSVFQQNVSSLALARRLKQLDPQLCVVFGGANCEGAMGLELIRQFPFVDAAVSGEADAVFPELVRKVLKGESPAGLTGVTTRTTLALSSGPVRAPVVRDLDALPYPEVDDFFEQFQASSAARVFTARLPFETSRGCWWGQIHHCTFCGLNGETMAYRRKSASRAMEELISLISRYPGHPVMVADNILDLSYFKDFVPELARRKLNVRLFYEVKANLKKEQVRLLRDAGILQIQPGIESFSDKVLELMRKGVRGLQNIQLLKWCKEFGIWPNWNLIWGFPGEPPEEYSRMADLVPLISHLTPPRAATRIRMDRFSPNFESSQELGFINVRPAAAYRYVYPFAPGALRNLAYYFDYDYAVPRDVRAYTRRLAERIEEWRRAHQQSELVCEDKGDQLLIWDLRPVAARMMTVLEGPERLLYLACDGVRAIRWLEQNAEHVFGATVASARIEEMLSPLLQQGLMMRDGDSILSLAVQAQPKPARA
ncbi:MAG: RiPP maturation radical SAM protein 1 [Acidobacteria bacterium]|nr:RiPP maturation radical SAM protein 1 [Acidobacteriota bacterium]